jgi:hypothetical protein
MKSPWIIPVAALTVGAAGGFISGRNTATPAETAQAEEQQAQQTRVSSRGGADAGATPRKSQRNGSVEEIFRSPGNSNRIQALIDFYSGLTAEQLAEEAEKLEGLPVNERMMASFILFGRWAEEDPTAAMAYTNSMGWAGAMVRPTVLQSWASVDPENAAKYYSENPREFAMMGGMGGRGGMGGQGGASIIAAEWARQDPAAALAWASSLGTEKGEAMTSVVSEVAKADPRRAAELAASMDPADRAGAYSRIASQWGASDFSAAQSWVRTLPLDQQAAAMSSAIEGLALKDPRAAATAIASMSGDAGDGAVRATVRNWAKEDPQGAHNWVLGLGTEDAQRNGLRELMPQWVAQNPVAAMNAVNNLPAGRVRDEAAASYVMSNNLGDPQSLMSVASTIDDDGTRMRSVGMVSMRWMREDPAAARAHIQQSSDIPDGMKERLLEGRPMWGGGGDGGGGAEGQRRRGGNR